MNVAANLILTFLGCFALLGWGIHEVTDLTADKRQLEDRLRTVQLTLSKAQAEVTDLTAEKHQLEDQLQAVQLALSEARAEVTQLKGNWMQMEEERDKAVDAARKLQSALSATQHKLNQSLSMVDELTQALSNASREYSKVSLAVKSLGTWVQRLTPQIQASHATAGCVAVDRSALPQRGDLGVLFLLAVVVFSAGYSGVQVRRRFKRESHSRSCSVPASLSSDDVVSICMPRAWIKDYVQWTRRMQAATQYEKFQ